MPQSLNPSILQSPKPLGLALRALIGGTCAGVGLVSAAMWLVRTLQVTGAGPLAPGPTDSLANLILAGWLGGAALGAAIAWGLMAPIASSYRRGGLTMVAGFGTLLLALVTAPVDSLLGRWGLLGLSAVLLAAALAIIRRRVPAV